MNTSTITVAAASRGAGATFYATNLAYYLTRRTRARVCIADVSVAEGGSLRALGLAPAQPAVHRRTGITVVPVPSLDPGDVGAVIDDLRASFDHVVIDLGAAPRETLGAALGRSDAFVAVTTRDRTSIGTLGVLLTAIEPSSGEVHLVLNDAGTDPAIDIDHATRIFPEGFISVLPRSAAVTRSVRRGTPVLGSSPMATISRRLARGMARVVGPTPRRPPPRPPAEKELPRR